MGYNTDFVGMLKFTKELTRKEEKELKKFMGANVRNHPEWNDFLGENPYLTYIDLKIAYNDETDNPIGLVWYESENTKDMVLAINLILHEMRKQFPDFGLEGRLEGWGAMPGDVFFIDVKKDGIAIKNDVYFMTSDDLKLIILSHYISEDNPREALEELEKACEVDDATPADSVVSMWEPFEHIFTVGELMDIINERNLINIR